MNVFMFSGRIADDPKKFSLEKINKEYCVFTICVKDSDNKSFHFFKLIAWNSVCKFIETYSKKGDTVLVSGKVHQNNYIDKKGISRHTTEFLVKSFEKIKSPDQGQTISIEEQVEVNPPVKTTTESEPEPVATESVNEATKKITS